MWFPHRQTWKPHINLLHLITARTQFKQKLSFLAATIFTWYYTHSQRQKSSSPLLFYTRLRLGCISPNFDLHRRSIHYYVAVSVCWFLASLSSVCWLLASPSSVCWLLASLPSVCWLLASLSSVCWYLASLYSVCWPLDSLSSVYWLIASLSSVCWLLASLSSLLTFVSASYEMCFVHLFYTHIFIFETNIKLRTHI